MKLTVGQLRKYIKDLPANMPVYLSDHDHSYYETNGRAGEVAVKDQSEMQEFQKFNKQESRDFTIEGKYLNIRI